MKADFWLHWTIIEIEIPRQSLRNLFKNILQELQPHYETANPQYQQFRNFKREKFIQTYLNED